MFRKTRLIIVLICFLLVNCSSLTKKDDIRWVTLNDIARSLKNQPPMNVGFDIDDTLLFSSPGYYYGNQKYSPGDNACLSKEEFCNEMNNGLDVFSIPKECARKLIELLSGIRAIRIKRAGNSTYKPLPKNGSLGEEVLVDSEY